MKIINKRIYTDRQYIELLENKIKELEEENETLKKEYLSLNKKCEKLEEENKRLHKDFKDAKQMQLLATDKYNEEHIKANELEDRINKSINYIEEHSLNYNGECEIDLEVEECKDLIKILKGSEDNESN